MARTYADSGLSHLTNSLASPIQLETSNSRLDGVPKDLETSIHYETARLLQAAGILLRLPQELVAQSIVVLYRFWVGPDGGSLVEHDSTEQDVAAASLYLCAKPSAHAISPSQTLTVFHYLSRIRPEYSTTAKQDNPSENIDWHLSEGDLEIARNRLYKVESTILRVLGFQTHVALPYSLCINYLQTLDASSSTAGSAVAKRAFAHLNVALFSPQMLYLTYQPSAIATAAIYLAARETDISLPETEWWEVFDVDREDLGFLVVALRSVEGFAEDEQRKWGQRKVPLTVDELRAELERRTMLENGE
ncbi:uncharacterized protein LTR77_005630 [Saxophila tyrrhenica]|uniref:Uncharacterized protein n=1 Tax=Saxophila tyrrhenica TaxID=1690608 RepID=A0AAV9P9U2_9PEZI|nr:hypothetical protein LTR77_005630 [Saxophila tyrrhenica]